MNSTPTPVLPSSARKQPTLYVYPALNRFGLAHELLTWARAIVWGHENGAAFIAPIWLRPRLGPFLRRERDKRIYFLLLTSGGAITGAKRLAVLTSSRRVEARRSWPERPMPGTGSTVVIFRTRIEGDHDLMPQLHGHEMLLRRELLKITRPRYRPASVERNSIAIHVRLGDFNVVQNQLSDVVKNNHRLPLDWFVNRLTALREALGKDVPAIVYSDGADAELASLLAQPGVRRAPRQQSVTDLLAMGQSAVVISSGSAFSLVGAFLGGASRLCHPGRLTAPAYSDNRREIESAFDAELPSHFVEDIRARLMAPPISV
jgi:hypothetical protein